MNAKQDKFLLSLGLAKRAGALSSGLSAVLDALRKKSAGIVFCASDVSAATRKKLRTSCAHYDVPLKDANRTMSELADAIGILSETAAVAVSRSSFLHLFESPENGGHHGGTKDQTE